MLKKEVPKILFRYHKESDWNHIFEKRTLKFSLLSKFNDPFEGNPSTDLVYKTSEKSGIGYHQFEKRVFNQWRAPLYHRATGISDFLLNQARFAVFSGSVAKENEPSLRKGFHNILANQNYGALCLTENITNILMWAHYANAHNGFIIGLNVINIIYELELKAIKKDLSEINYVNKRPSLSLDDIIDNGDTEERLEFFKKCFFTKSILWKYEQEWRLLISFLREDGSRVGELIPLSPLSVVNVIFGMKMSDDDIRKKCCAVRSISEYSHVKFKRAVIHDTDYAVVIEDIDDDFFLSG